MADGIKVTKNASASDITKQFAAKIVKADGKVSLVIQSNVYFQHEMAIFDNEDKVMLTVTSKKPKRTVQQNSYYWGVILKMVGNEVGESNMKYLHEALKEKFLLIEETVVVGTKIRVFKSTTDLSVKDFSKYIRDICAEFNIIAPPTENFGLKPLN